MMLSHGIPYVIVAGMLGHSISILLNTYAHFIVVGINLIVGEVGRGASYNPVCLEEAQL
jgi:hypothetical protein